MNTTLDLTYRGMDSSPSIEHVIREQLEKLERHVPSILSCRVVVEAPSAKHTKGGHFHVTVDVGMPGHEIVADRDSSQKHSHEDCHAAIRDAFRAALKEIEKIQDKARTKNRHG